MQTALPRTSNVLNGARRVAAALAIATLAWQTPSVSAPTLAAPTVPAVGRARVPLQVATGGGFLISVMPVVATLGGVPSAVSFEINLK